MSFSNNKVWTRVLKAVAILACLVAAISGGGTSCSKKSTTVDDDTLKQPPWNQMKIDWFASWSPDGSKIIYTRDPAEGIRDTLWAWGGFIRDVASGKDTCIWPNVKFDGFSWSPEGRKVALTQNAQIFIYDFENDSLRQITHQNRNFGVRWSPCGDKLVFFVRANGGGLFIYDFDTDSITHVPGRDEADAGDWMPDCSTLVMLDSCKYTECDVYAYNIYTDSLWWIHSDQGYHRDLTVSPNGETVVFSSESQLWRIATMGGEAQQLTTEGGDYPDFSPDGQWIVYTKVDRRNGYLWLMRPDGSEKHQITF